LIAKGMPFNYDTHPGPTVASLGDGLLDAAAVARGCTHAREMLSQMSAAAHAAMAATKEKTGADPRSAAGGAKIRGGPVLLEQQRRLLNGEAASASEADDLVESAFPESERPPFGRPGTEIGKVYQNWCMARKRFRERAMCTDIRNLTENARTAIRNYRKGADREVAAAAAQQNTSSIVKRASSSSSSSSSSSGSSSGSGSSSSDSSSDSSSSSSSSGGSSSSGSGSDSEWQQ
jgi:hypothetical protein